MNYQLVVLKGRSASSAIKLKDGVTTLGRSNECNLKVASSQVSRKHCQLFERNGYLMVKDLGSANGVLVNGELIDEQRVLDHGDELLIGDVTFRVERLGQAAAPAAPVVAAAAPVVREGGSTAEATALEVADALIDEEEEFEIDFGDVDATIQEAPLISEVDVEDEVFAALAVEPAAPAAAPQPPPPVPPPVAAAPEPKPVPPPAERAEPNNNFQLGDDAVAEFLMDIKLEDD